MKKVDLQDFNCAGCSACANICPKGAISMRPSAEGFYNPVIDEDKCIDCGLCYKICPECHPVEKNTDTPDCYAIMASDEIRAKSSSGGVFSVLAHEIFSRGGVVCGAAFDENWTVRHIIIDKEEDMDQLRGSKYVQSFIAEDIYKQLKDHLKQGRWVLFSGVPCQVAGFKAFLGKDYDTLVLVDLLCSCAPSPKVFKKYLEDRVPEIKDIIGINFRDKRAKGWGVSHTIQTASSDTEDGRFIRAFLSKTISNRTCKTCKYATVAKVSDVTMADFWGIARYKAHLDDKKGTSIYLANTPKGREMLSCVKSQFKLVEAVPLKRAMQPIMKAPYPENVRREKFLSMIEESSFTDTYEKLLGKKNVIGIINYGLEANRGAVLTNYALHEFLKENGYKPLSVSFSHLVTDPNTFAWRFAKKYNIQRTTHCPDYTALKNLNQHIETFILGSDQVLRPWCINGRESFFFLDWVNEKAKKIACSASFGMPYLQADDQQMFWMRKSLKRFDAISLREKTGIGLLKNHFNLPGIQIIDPVFWIDINKYKKIAATSQLHEKDNIAYYFLWDTPEKRKMIKYLENKLGVKAVDMIKDKNLEDWLYRIEHCKLLITDSFHATSFSLLFKKNFITVSPHRPPYESYDDRIQCILETVHMPERQLLRADEIYDREDLLKEITYDETLQNILCAEVDRAKEWLLSALERPKVVKEYTDDEKAFYVVMDKMNQLRDMQARQMGRVMKSGPSRYASIEEVKALSNQWKYRFKYRAYKILGALGLKHCKKRAAHYKQYVQIIRRLS